MFTNMTAQKLTSILSQIEPVELKGLALLREGSPSRRCQPQSHQWFPAELSSRLLAEAATEMMDYMSGCERAIESLKKLPPVPLAAPVEEWPL